MKAMSYDQDHQELTSTPTNNTFDWFDDSISFLDGEDDLGGYDWWSTLLPAAQQDGIGNTTAQTSLPPPAPPAGALSQSHVAATTVASPPLEIPKKRKSLAHKASGHYSQCRGVEHHKEDQSYNRKPSGGGSKKGGTKGGATSSNKDTRWAEQLLNPCAVALEAGNLPRVQHLLYVLGELASFSGDVNHRLAAHGLRALALRLPAAVGPAVAATVRVPPCECPTPAFARADPRLFRASLIKFQEVSPWFALPNALANAAIAHAATRDVHVIDVGVSHGVQWPTLLEAFTRLPSGREPPAVRLSVAGPTATALVPFSASPPCYNFSPHLLRYAKSINLELAISTVTSLDLVRVTPGETLVVCLQFRLGHVTADKRTDILRKVRGLNPELVVLSELDTGGDGSAAGEFAARLELLWRFLESTAAAFKGREGEERRLMEAEAGTAVAPSAEEAGEGREGWRGRMTAAGFEEVALGDEPVEAAKSLLRKYDGGWEMAVPTAAAAVLRWKGQPVSFCSLWRPA